MTGHGKCFALWSCTATLCCAQVLPPAELEEVLVTAQRREQRAQDVPMSLSVFSNEQIARRQIHDIDALQFAAPNLVVASHQTSRGAASIAMRGQFERDGAPTVDPAVGLYLDGVYIARTTGANLRMFDLDRVEVLRGPQGTLYGRNTVGGAINVIPRLPVAEFEGAVSARLGNYNQQEITGMINIPLDYGESAMRLTGALTAHDGYAESAITGRDIADDDTGYARVQVRVAPQDFWNVNLSFDYTRSTGGSQWMTLVAAFPPASPIPQARGNPDDSIGNYVDPFTREPSVNRSGEARSTTWGTAANFAIEAGDVTFKSITAVRGLAIEAYDSDQDGTPYDISVILGRDDRQDQFSQEFQAYGSALDARLEWIGGLFYFEEQARMSQQFPLLAPGSFDTIEQDFWGDVRNESLAAYAQLTYALRPDVHLTAGARYNRDKRQLTSRNSMKRNGVQGCRINPSLLDNPAYCEATLPERQFDYVPFTLSFDYQPVESTLLYAKASRGHRAGGYNLRGTSETDFAPFGPEEVLSYELGAKTSLLDQRLRVDMAVYRTSFDDIQITERTALEPGSPLGLPTIRNGGEARIEGGELELSALLKTLEVSAAVGVTEAQFTRINPAATDVRVGSSFLMTPKVTTALALDWPVIVRGSLLRFHADYAWRDEISFWYDPNTLARQESYGLLNATISMRFARSDLELSLWGRNLTDTRYFQRAFQNVFLVAAIPGDPLTCGVAFSYSFD